MKRFEIVLGIIFFVGAFLTRFQFPGALFLTFCTGFLLSVFYFIFSFAIMNNIKASCLFTKSSYSMTSAINLILAIIYGWIYSLFITGIFHIILKWENGHSFFVAGIFLMLLVLILSIVLWANHQTFFFKRLVIRTTIILICGILMVVFH